MLAQHDGLPIPPELAIEGDEPFTTDDLDFHAAGGHSVERVDKFVVTNDDLAEWALAKLAEAQQELVDATLRRDAYVERIDAWYGRDVERLTPRVAFFKGRLTAYMRSLREADAHRKSLSLPSGRLTSTGRKPRVTIVNDDALLEYVKQNWSPEDAAAVIKTVETVLVSKLADRVVVADGRAVDKATGEIVPGMGVDPGGVDYGVSL